MSSVCLKGSLIKKTVGVLTSLGVSLTLASSAFAQTASTASSSLTKGGLGGTESALPSAGSTEITYIIFGAGTLLFIYGMMRLVASFRE
ncbi:MAG: hypothetical protein AAB512_03855 [Patescibacteria group bacterium]